MRKASPIEFGESDAVAKAEAAFRRLRHETLSAERRAVIALRDQGVISDEILHRLEQELDIEAMRIGLGEVRMDAAP
jgi:CPA1 family monovalent cation:H+ antiporter